ncbi:MAG: hypothetical protein NC485_13630 [Ruminococcus flavefaciens]|nr:hypothetical protein [Ruminococcus flavefaciens]MCM1061728.1 hypothetical protein [Eubacterium sp.]
MSVLQGCLAKKGEKMIFEYPLILVAKKEFLESFQRGDLYMTSCLRYQQMEKDDPKRGDKYDGAVKCTYNGYNIDDNFLKDVDDSKIMILATYIKCFYHFKDNDVQKIGDNEYSFTFSKKSTDEFNDFNEEYALIIYDVPKFIERFSNACKSNKNIANYFYSDVIYIDDEEYPKYEKDLIRGVLGEKTDCVVNPAFLKRKKYSPQQEFRIAVSLNIGEPPVNATGIKIPESIDFSMEEIKDISIIVKLQDIVKKSVFARITTSGEKKGARIEYYL